MQLKSIKRASEIVLDGIAVEIEMRDGSLHAVTFTDKSGNFCKVAKSDYSTMSAYIAAPPTKVKKFQLSGTLEDVSPVKEVFDDEWTANNRKAEIEKKFDYREGVKLEVAPVEIEEPF